MSVPQRDRGESPVEYLAVARKLRVEVLRYCMKLPKRLTFYMGIRTMERANDVYDAVIAANSTYVTNRLEARERRLLLVQANNALWKLNGYIETLRDYLMENPEIFAEGLPDDEEHERERKKKIRKGKKRVSNATQQISALINREADLIKGVKESDQRRYKNLPE